MIDQTVTIVLSGGGPWGFSLSGGIEHNQELSVSNVETGGPADSNQGLIIGDRLRSVNRIPVRTRAQAINLIRQTGEHLHLGIQRSTEQPLRNSKSVGNLDSFSSVDDPARFVISTGSTNDVTSTYQSGHYLRHSSNELHIDSSIHNPPPVPPRPPVKSLASPVHSSNSSLSSAARWQAACDYANVSRSGLGHRRTPSSPLSMSSNSSVYRPSDSSPDPDPHSHLRRPLRIETFIAPERRQVANASPVYRGSIGRTFQDQYPTDNQQPSPHPVLSQPYVHLPASSQHRYSSEDMRAVGTADRPMSWHADDDWKGDTSTPGAAHSIDDVTRSNRKPQLTTQLSQEQMRAKMSSLPNFYAAAHHRPRRSGGASITALPSRQALPHSRSQSANTPVNAFAPPFRERNVSESEDTNERREIIRSSSRPSLMSEIAAERVRMNGEGDGRRAVSGKPQDGCQLGRSDSDASTLVPQDARTLSPCETPPRLDSPPTPEVFTGIYHAPTRSCPAVTRFIDVTSGWTSEENNCQEETRRAFSGRNTPEGLSPVRGRYIDVGSDRDRPATPNNEPSAPPQPSRSAVQMTSEQTSSPPALPPRRRTSLNAPPRPVPALPVPQPEVLRRPRPLTVRKSSLDGESTIPRSEYARLLRKKQESILLRSSVRGRSSPAPSPPAVPPPPNSTEKDADGPPQLPPRSRRTAQTRTPPCEVSNPIYDDLSAIVGRQQPRLSSASSSPSGGTPTGGSEAGSRPSSLSANSPSSTMPGAAGSPVAIPPSGYLPNSYISSRRLPRQGYDGNYRNTSASPHLPTDKRLNDAASLLAAGHIHRGQRAGHVSEFSQGSSAGSEHARTPSKESVESGEAEERLKASPDATLLGADHDEEVFEEVGPASPLPDGSTSGRESVCSGGAAAAVGEVLKQELADSCVLHIRERSREEEQLLEHKAEAIVERLPDRKLSLALTCPPVSRLETHLRDMVVKDGDEEDEEKETENETEESEDKATILRLIPNRTSGRNGRRGSLSSVVDTDSMKKELLRCFKQRLDLKKQDKPEWEDRQRENMELQEKVRTTMEQKCKSQVKRLERLCHDVDCLFKLMCQLAQRLLVTDETLSRLTKMGASDAELDRIRSQRTRLQAQTQEARQIRSKLCSRQLDFVETVEEYFSDNEQEEFAQFIRGLWTISLHRHLIESGIRADEAKVSMLRESLDLTDEADFD